MSRRGALDVVEGFYTGHAVWALHRLGALSRLGAGAEPSELAGQLGCDPTLLVALFEYVHQTTDLLDRHGDHYRVAAPYREYNAAGFHLDKFIGAYGPAIAGVLDLLHGSGRGPALRDGDALARAFARRVAHRPSLTLRLLHTWDVTSLLDVGCGVGTLLIELAESDPTFRGWGVDASRQMVDVATERVRLTGLDGRVLITQGDVRTLDAAVTGPMASAGVAAVYGRSLLNEFFADGGRGASEVLSTLRRLLPGRLLFVEDYYGRLTHGVGSDTDHQHTALQDLAQVVSGQGVPPPDLAGWARIYAAAGCELLKAYEGDNDGIRWFVHVLVL
jgi:SAM-dependent methyltransferase